MAFVSECVSHPDSGLCCFFPILSLSRSCFPVGGVMSKGSTLCLSLELLFDFINYQPTAAVIWHNLAF